MRKVGVPVATAAAVFVVLALAQAAGIFGAYRAQASDALFPVGRTDSRIAVVGVDRRAIESSGVRWPWPRTLQAQLVNTIAAAKPRLIVLDIVYNPATGDDPALAAALRNAGDVILASQAQAVAAEPRVYAARGIADPVPSVAAGHSVAHAVITPDNFDGVVRSVPLVLDSPDHEFVPSLALDALAHLDGASDVVTVRPHGVQIGQRYVPTESHTRLRVAFTSQLSGQRGLQSVISAADVLAGRTPAPRLAGKVVFVGVTDVGLGDLHTTPVDKGAGTPGVLIHANALNTMLTRQYLAVAGRTETLLWMAVLSVFVVFTGSRLRLWASGALAVVLVVAYGLVTFVRIGAGTEMDLIFPPLTIALAYLASVAVRVTIEARERSRVAGLLEQYVPTPIARHLLARGRAHGHPPTGELTFLFTDVVGSTEAWEGYPREMSEAMKRHDVLVETAVEDAGGAVVRPRGEGDSRFCVFVAPIDAVHAALAINRALDAERWQTPEPVRVRMGIHTGNAELRDADYYGSTVNRCARIRGVASAGEIVMSSVTAELVRDSLHDAALSDRGLHELKGMAEPEHVFEVVPPVMR